MDYEAIELDIRDKLIASAPSNVIIEELPNHQSAFHRAFDKPRVYIAMREEEAFPPKSTAEISQMARLFFDFTIQSTSRYGSDGIYAVKNSITSIMLGYKPLGLERLIEAGFRFEQYEDDLFTYSLTLSTTAVLVQPDNPPDYTTLVSSITINDNVIPGVVPPVIKSVDIVDADLAYGEAAAQLNLGYPVAVMSGVIVHYDASILGQKDNYVGFLANAPAAGEIAIIKKSGFFEGGPFEPNKEYYVNIGGGIIDTAPVGAAFTRKVAVGVTIEKIKVFVNAAVVSQP